MRTRCFLLVVAACLAIFVPTAHGTDAQTPVALTGLVTSFGNGALEGVLISAKKAGSTITVTVVSDQQGHYRFPAVKLEAGRYELTVRAASFELSQTTDLSKQLTNADWLLSMPGSPAHKSALLGCVQCHTLERVVKSPHDAEAFTQVVQRMGTYANQSTPLHIQTRRAERLLEMR